MTPTRIVLAGASWAEEGGALARSARADSSVPVIAAGVRGATVRRWPLELVARHDIEGATVVVFEGGGNDPGTPLEQRTAAIADADHLLRDAGAAWVLWTRPPAWPTPSAIARARDATDAAIAAAGVRTTALRRVRFGAGDVAADGAHPTARGYERIWRSVHWNVRAPWARALVLAGGGTAAAIAAAWVVMK